MILMSFSKQLKACAVALALALVGSSALVAKDSYYLRINLSAAKQQQGSLLNTAAQVDPHCTVLFVGDSTGLEKSEVVNRFDSVLNNVQKFSITITNKLWELPYLYALLLDQASEQHIRDTIFSPLLKAFNDVEKTLKHVRKSNMCDFVGHVSITKGKNSKPSVPNQTQVVDVASLELMSFGTVVKTYNLN